jgi:hypothetical protein
VEQIPSYLLLVDVVIRQGKMVMPWMITSTASVLFETFGKVAGFPLSRE